MADVATPSIPSKQRLFVWLLPILALLIVFGFYLGYDKLSGVSVYQDDSGRINIVGPDGWPDRWIDSHDPRMVAQTVNLPATFIVLPFELLIHGARPAENPSF